MVFCSVCKCHHHKSAFGTQQLRKSAKTRICRNPKPVKTSHFSSFGEYADYLEFGPSRYWYVERTERQWEDSDDE